jgi:hypothetical protein
MPYLRLMILILTRNDIHPEFLNLPASELSLQHVHMTVSHSGAMSAATFAGNVVFLNDDESVEVLKSNLGQRSFPSILHFIATLTHRHVPTLDLKALIRDLSQSPHGLHHYVAPKRTRGGRRRRW